VAMAPNEFAKSNILAAMSEGSKMGSPTLFQKLKF